MGLDSYLFKEKPGDTQFDLPMGLVGGMFSGHGSDGSFRGKVYEGVFNYLTEGETLYTEEADNSWVRMVASRMRKNLDEAQKDPESMKALLRFLNRSDYDMLEVEALVQLFEQAGEKGCKYGGWW